MVVDEFVSFGNASVVSRYRFFFEDFVFVQVFIICKEDLELSLGVAEVGLG